MMFQDMDRRNLLRSMGASVLGSSNIASATAARKNIIEVSSPEEDVDTNIPQCPPSGCGGGDGPLEQHTTESHEELLAGGAIISHSRSVAYFGSTYIESRNKWYHDIRFTSYGSADNYTVEGVEVDEVMLDKQYFEISGGYVEFTDTTDEDYFGVLPLGDVSGGQVISNVDILVAVASGTLGAVYPSVGVTLSAYSFLTALKNRPENGQYQNGEGLAMEHQKLYCGPIQGCRATDSDAMGHFKRLFVTQDCEQDEYCQSSFNLKTGMIPALSPGKDTPAEIDEMLAVKTDEDDGFMSSTTNDPIEMGKEKLDKYNIREVPLSSISTLKRINHPASDVASKYASESDTVYYGNFPFTKTG